MKLLGPDFYNISDLLTEEEILIQKTAIKLKIQYNALLNLIKTCITTIKNNYIKPIPVPIF